MVQSMDRALGLAQPLAQHLIGSGVLCEPDSREPWFISAAHDQACLERTLAVFEEGVDATLRHVLSMGGTVAAEHGIGKLKRRWLPLQLSPAQLSIMRAVKRELDPLGLLAVDGRTNQQKGDGDAATWLPPNRSFWCPYVARQVAVKAKYGLWTTPAEHAAIARVLDRCPDEPVPVP